MYNTSSITDFMRRTKTSPKLYVEQRLSVNNEEVICYYLYTMVTEDQVISKEDLADLVIIPDSREKIVGDFNTTDKSMPILEVVKAIHADAKLDLNQKFQTLKTPIWSYMDNIDVMRQLAITQ